MQKNKSGILPKSLMHQKRPVTNRVVEISKLEVGHFPKK